LFRNLNVFIIFFHYFHLFLDRKNVRNLDSFINSQFYFLFYIIYLRKNFPTPIIIKHKFMYIKFFNFLGYLSTSYCLFMIISCLIIHEYFFKFEAFYNSKNLYYDEILNLLYLRGAKDRCLIFIWTFLLCILDWINRYVSLRNFSKNIFLLFIF